MNERFHQRPMGKKRSYWEVMIANCIPGVVVSARWLVSSAGYSPGCRATAEGCPLENRKKNCNWIKLRIDNIKREKFIWETRLGKKIPPFNFLLEKSNCQFNWSLKKKKKILSGAPDAVKMNNNNNNNINRIISRELYTIPEWKGRNEYW